MSGLKRGFLLVSVILAMLAGWTAAAQVPTTTVEDTVYYANGTAAQGTVIVSWNAFTTANGAAIAAGNTTVTLGTGGALTIALAPNLGSTPMGNYYTAVYHLNDGETSREFWVIPSVIPGGGPAKLAGIRNQVLPTSVAMQTVTKQYVDDEILAAQIAPIPLDSSPYVLKAGDTMTGPLVLPGDPASALQAADKNYVDNNIAAIASNLNGSAITSGTVSAARLPVFGPSGTTHAAGIVPDPGATAGSTRFLREDGTWNIPAGSGGGAPSGTASGDLCGSYPSPTVCGANGATVPPSSAYVGTNGSSQIVAATTPLLPTNNLSDVSSASTARTNLGLGSMAVQAASTVAITGGTINNTVIGGTTPAAGTFTTLAATTVSATGAFGAWTHTAPTAACSGLTSSTTDLGVSTIGKTAYFNITVTAVPGSCTSSVTVPLPFAAHVNVSMSCINAGPANVLGGQIIGTTAYISSITGGNSSPFTGGSSQELDCNGVIEIN